MTILIALKDHTNNQIILGTDTQTTAGQIKYKAETKVIKKTIRQSKENIIQEHTIYIAITGRAYMKNFIEHGFDAPDMDRDEIFIEYLHRKFLPELVNELSDNKLIIEDHGQADTETGMIIIFNNEIYQIEDNFGVNTTSHNDYVAIGSGWEVALGSLRTSLKLNQKLSPETHVREAICAAGELTVYCNDDVQITKIKADGVEY